MKPQVAVIMGSVSDWETMKHACEQLDELGISYIKQVVSAHRTPDLMFEFAENARDNGLKVIIVRVVLLICRGWWQQKLHYR